MTWVLIPITTLALCQPSQPASQSANQVTNQPTNEPSTAAFFGVAARSLKIHTFTCTFTSKNTHFHRNIAHLFAQSQNHHKIKLTKSMRRMWGMDGIKDGRLRKPFRFYYCFHTDGTHSGVVVGDFDKDSELVCQYSFLSFAQQDGKWFEYTSKIKPSPFIISFVLFSLV